MFPHTFGGALSLPQLDRVRWNMFPEVRVQTQGALFDDNDADAELPSIMRVMDLQQEQLARSLGDGHRVIHGVAGSGKTMILGYRAEYLAKACTPTHCLRSPKGMVQGSRLRQGGSSAVHCRCRSRSGLGGRKYRRLAAGLCTGDQFDQPRRTRADRRTGIEVPTGVTARAA
jgi:hypothetical protein